VNVKRTLWAILMGTVTFNPLASAAWTGISSTAHADTDAMQERSIPINVYNGFLVVTTGQIGGVEEKQNFVLDTGTAPSILNERSARKMGLQVTHGTLVAVGRTISTAQTVLPELELGPIRVADLPMNVMNLSQLEKSLGIQVAGLIGMDVLGRASFRLDYEKRELHFGSVADEGIEVPYDDSTSLALAEVTLQGKHVRMIVDTGSDLVVVYGSDWNMVDPAQRASEGTSVAEQVPAWRIAHPELALGGKQFRGMRTYYVPSTTKTGYDGFLGVRALKLRGISFNRDSKTMYLLN
jgi:predicted aspartyl protease